MDVDGIIAQATAATGLDDVGDPAAIGALTVLVDATRRRGWER